MFNLQKRLRSKYIHSVYYLHRKAFIIQHSIFRLKIKSKIKDMQRYLPSEEDVVDENAE
jgi:hypothetical protein